MSGSGRAFTSGEFGVADNVTAIKAGKCYDNDMFTLMCCFASIIPLHVLHVCIHQR